MFGDLDIATTLLRIGASIVVGLVIALFYMYKSDYSKSFVITLTLLPAIVGAVVTIVNGNLGTGVAVMGAFSLVRFRSIPGSAKEIGFIFFAMAAGLAAGMGYIAYAGVFTLCVGLMSLLLYKLKFAESKQASKQLKVTIPENLEYAGLFDDLFNQYTVSAKLNRVKTTNMGSMFQLQYDIILKDQKQEKEMIDQIRTRNGNLDIMCGYISDSSEAVL
jgi:hypothetical protein